MASERALTVIGSVTESTGAQIKVYRRPRDGAVLIDDLHTGLFTADGATQLAELLNRAAMPGQVPPAAEARDAR